MTNAGSARANCPIPYSLGIFYFEITVLNSGLHGYIGIGLSHKTNSLNSFPGWNTGTLGYHGDDGKLFNAEGWGKNFGPTFTTGDVIGCGVDFVNWKIFFTKNGELIGKI